MHFCSLPDIMETESGGFYACFLIAGKEGRMGQKDISLVRFFENQDRVHYGMPVRIIVEDAFDVIVAVTGSKELGNLTK